MIDRRRLPGSAIALAATRFIDGAAHARVRAAPRLTADPFALGVASGDPTAQGMVLWTRVAGLNEDAGVAFEIAEDDGFRRIVRAGRAIAPLARGGAVHVAVNGLRPGRPYFYRFHCAGAVSRTGRTVTAALAPDRARFALTSCQHREQGWFGGYRDMIARAPGAVIQPGDYIYDKSFGRGPDMRSFAAPDPRTLEDYRARHALYRTGAPERDRSDVRCRARRAGGRLAAQVRPVGRRLESVSTSFAQPFVLSAVEAPCREVPFDCAQGERK